MDRTNHTSDTVKQPSTTIIGASDVTRLANADAPPIVSIYMPTHRGPDSKQDPIRLKNCITRAGKELHESKRWSEVFGSDALAEELQQAARLVNDPAFWRRGGTGLALFLGDGLFHLYRSAVPFTELTTVGRNPHVVPLLEAIEEGTEFYLLAVSKRHVRLLQGSRDAVAELDLPGIDDRISAFFDTTGESPPLQFRSVRRESQAGGGVMFHGHGDAEHDDQEPVRKLLRAVAEAISTALGDTKAPIIFAGDASLFPVFRELHSVKTLVDEPLHGNPDDESLEALHARAWPLVEERLTRRRDATAAAIAGGITVGKGATDTAKILHAAIQGRVDHLLVVSGAHTWGRCDEATAQVQVLPNREADCEDLHNLAAIFTLRHNGLVSTVSAEQCPYDSSIAAKFRY